MKTRLLLALWAVFTLSCASPDRSAVVVCPHNATLPERLAAQEVRRYVYLRTGTLLPVRRGGEPQTAQSVVVGRKDRPAVLSLAKEAGAGKEVAALGDQQYLIRTVSGEAGPRVLVAGGDEIGALYGAYRLAEHLGVRFYLHGDTVPDGRIPFRWPELDETARPLFALRGIQPFHDFPEGPDWWNLDDYKAIISQLPKLRMNFIGFHTYPEGKVGPEPMVWIGPPEEVAEDGSVEAAYRSRHFTTVNGTWGYRPKMTGDYGFGADRMFEEDEYGADVMRGRTPWPKPEDSGALFNEFGKLLRGAFEHARALGIRTCIGTETPLIVPTELQERLKAAGKDPADPAVVQSLYEGMFRRIAKAHPLDYYWLWTPEIWTWKDVPKEQVDATLKDLKLAVAAAQKAKSPFTLATCGWVLGPQQDRALFDRELPKQTPVSCINRQVGKDPVEPGFAQVTDRPQWAIPWMEDDPGMVSPQLWVGRMRRDAFDALRYGCSGLMGIHWRTRILGPNVSALAKAAWDQSGWSEGVDAAQPPRHLKTGDFYADWARTQFGPEAAADIADIFARMDGRMPEPATWVEGPGGIKPDPRPWADVAKEYAFVDELAELRPLVKGAGNLDRFDFWLDTFEYMKVMARVRCSWTRFQASLDRINGAQKPGDKIYEARSVTLPVRINIVRQLSGMYRRLLATVTNTSEMGTVANWEQHISQKLLDEPGLALENVLGEKLPPEARPDKVYRGPARIVVPTLRTSLDPGEALRLRVIVLAAEPVGEAALFWRPLGTGKFRQVPLTAVKRSVYSAEVPAASADFEYYIRVLLEGGKQVHYPVTAPEMNQTVVVPPAK